MDQNLIELMQRREALLDLEPGGPPHDLPTELESVTAELKAGLEGQDLRIRSLSLATDEELLLRLAGLESIHPLDDPEDFVELGDRLAPDRRCFVLEHPGLAGHPLNVVWVALTKDTPRRIASVLGRDRERIAPDEADTAVFYSIWSVERGLRGIPGGASLLGLAMKQLRLEFPQVRTFVTLSPIPGFRQWASQRGADGDPTAEGAGVDLVGSNSADSDEARIAVPGEESHAELMGACARYLTEIGPDGRLIDPVARFHMRNGARLWRINWHGDLSARGLDRAWGLMANYRYEPEDREANKSALANERPTVGAEVETLLHEFRA